MPATPVGVHSAATRRGDMATIAQHAITEVLGELRDGVPGALDRLIPLVYEDLARIAHRQLGLEGAGHTLSTSALVHEAYLRLVDQTRAHWADRAQFYAVAAHVMRRVLVDHARRHRAARRGGANPRSISLDALDSKDAGSLAVDDRADILLAIDEALERLAMLDARQARVVDCRFFGGLTETETAEALGVTTRTVERDWVKARGWLYQELSNDAL
jgi:RNA polymerase sigma factor (TIGR02999 family)